MRAPRVKRVWGCIDTGYEWPNTPESGRSAAGISNVTAANTLVNGFLELGRAEFGTVEVRGLVGGYSIGWSTGQAGEHAVNKGIRNVGLAWVKVVAVVLVFLIVDHPTSIEKRHKPGMETTRKYKDTMFACHVDFARA